MIKQNKNNLKFKYFYIKFKIISIMKIINIK